MATAMTQKGQVTIPVAIRRALGLKPHDRVVVELDADRAVLRRAPSAILAGYGSVKPQNRPEDFAAKRREFEEGIAQEVIAETRDPESAHR